MALTKALLVAATVVVSPAHADTGISPILGLSAGTGGIGLQGGVQLSQNLSIRAILGDLDVDETREIDGIDYEVDATIKIPMLLVDYHPFGGGFYISGGLARNSSSIGGLATLAEPTQVGSVIVDPSDVGALRATAKYDDTVPYAGIGWRSGMRSAWAWQLELGVSAMSDPEVVLEEEGSNFISQADLDAEAAAIKTDVEDTVSVYPHLRIGLQYRF